jgi:ABC-2 type transport system permease protein
MTGQFAAIAKMRAQLFVNSLFTVRGNVELMSRIFVVLFFAIGGLGAAAGLGAGAWYLMSHHQEFWLAALLWPVFLFWQLFPILATAFTENLDSSNLLRFPLSFRDYFAIRMAYGLLDPASVLGSLWLLSILAGIAIASPALLVWSALVMGVFAVSNLLLGRMLFAWLERWLAQRRTREIFSVIFFLLLISFQFAGPLLNRYGERSRREVAGLTLQLTVVQRVLPPGIAAWSIAEMSASRIPTAIAALMILLLYGALFFVLLRSRLRKQYQGESLSEADTPGERAKVRIQPAWFVPGLSSPTAASLEKELHYLSRSGPMLLTLIMPVFMLLIFRIGPAGRGGLLSRMPQYALLAGAAYALLILTNFVYNNFGAEGSGIQFLFASPARFRQIVLGKNLAHMTVFACEMLLVSAGVAVFYGPPSLSMVAVTLCGVLFAAPLNLAVGNLLSLYSPKKIDQATFGRQRASQTTVLVSFAVQLTVFGVAALALHIGQTGRGLWLTALLFLISAVLTTALYIVILGRIDGIVLKKREDLVAELSRA